MNSRAIKFFITLVVAAAAAAHFPVLRAKAQQQPQPAAAASPTPPAAQTTADGGQSSRVSARLERGGRVAVDNFTTGRIRVVGWDGDTVEATASSERGDEAVKIQIGDAAGVRRIVLDTAYADDGRFQPDGETILKSPPAKGAPGPFVKMPGPLVKKIITRPSPKDAKPTPSPQDAKPTPLPQGAKPTPSPWPPDATPTPDEDLTFVRRPREIHLEVRVPRYAELELIRVFRSPVEVVGVETSVVIVGDRGEVRVKSVGAAEVRTRSGGVEVEDVRGLADVFTVGGTVAVRRTPGDVRARSIDGRVEVACVGGRVDVTSTDGSVALAAVRGDVDASTTSGDIAFAGALRADGRYYLKSMTGRVEMAVAVAAGGAASPVGFNASLSSYRGAVSTDLELKLREDTSGAPANRRLVGRHGDGRAQVTLDSFEGSVRLTKAPPEAANLCR